MNRTLQERPQHSGSDARFPHTPGPGSFPPQPQCCTAATGARLCPPSPQLICSLSQKTRQTFTPRMQKEMTLFSQKAAQVATLLPSRAINPRLEQKARLRETQIQVSFLPGHIWSYHGLNTFPNSSSGEDLPSVFREERRKHLPTIFFHLHFFEEREGREA